MVSTDFESQNRCPCYHHDKPDCRAKVVRVRPDGSMAPNPWICTKEAGHEGKHVACGGSGHHEMFSWDRV